MGEWLSNLMAQFQALPAGRRAALVLTAAGSLAFFLWLGSGAGRADYRLLFRGLDEDEAAKVLDGLGAEKIPYRIEEGGTAILVPASLVYEARIRVAGRGLPVGSAGFEIFDDAGFGVTDFVQKVNYQRALQGELARSVEQLEAVERVRVQIAMPERTPFMRKDANQASASVVVRLRPGAELQREQVRGIVHLVSSSVQRLDPSRVTVVDTHGRMLAPLADGQPGPKAPAGALAQQATIEQQLAERVESILVRTVGAGRVVARVSAELDWTQIEQTEERFDPDSQVARSEQRSSDSSEDGSGGAAGIPGIRSNSPGGVAAATGGQSGRAASRSSETVNYEISKVVSRRIDPVGSIKRIDVAVLLDGKPPEPGAEAEAGFQPWSQQELDRFEELARHAVGFSSERGDRITLTSAPFHSVEVGDDEGFRLDPQLLALLATLLNYLGLFLALALFARFLGRPLISALTANAGAALPVRAGDLEAQLAGSIAAPPPVASLADQVSAIADRRGEDSVKTLRGWLDQQE